VAYGSLPQKLSEMKLLPTSLVLMHGDQYVQASFDDLGIYKDAERAAKSANSQRSWLPLINLVRSPELKAPIRIDEARFNTKIAELAKTLRKDTVNARLVLSGTTVTIQPGTDGFELKQPGLQKIVVTALDMGKSTVDAPTDKTTPKVTVESLQEPQKALENQLKTSVVYKFASKSKQAGSGDIAKWFIQSGETYTLDPAAIRAFVTQVGKDFGIRIKDINSVVTSSQQAVTGQKALTVTLIEQKTAAKVYKYCVAAKGVDASYLPTLKNKLQSTYSDSRGWSLDGLVEFQEVANGCNFTVWLTAANLMPSFGAICDPMWSCRVGPNVVLNFDRWQGASPSWNANGGSLEDYRHMVINHETGHWLGFGHDHCGGAGQPAPVMQQQSIDLQGCKFNPWPVAAELGVLRRNLGL